MNTAEVIYTTNTDTYLKTIQNHIYFRDADGLHQFLADPALKSSMSILEWAEFINMPINNDGDTLLIWACYQGYDAIVDFLIAEPDTNLLKADFHGFDALTVCQHAKRDHLVQKLRATLEMRQQVSAPSPFEFAEPEKPVTTTTNTIKEWLYGGKTTSNQNTPPNAPAPLRAMRSR